MDEIQDFLPGFADPGGIALKQIDPVVSEEVRADNGLFRTDELMPQAAHDPAHPSSRIKLVYSREDFSKIPLPQHAALYPELRYMGSKHRLLPWIHGVLRGLNFETAADPFTGSGCVAYLLKTMGKRVVASDFLNFPTVLAEATVANSKYRLDTVQRVQTSSLRTAYHYPSPACGE